MIHFQIYVEIFFLLEYNCAYKKHVVFIEEIPISSENDYKEFVSHFFSLLISKKQNHGLNKVKFVLSSIKIQQIILNLFSKKYINRLSLLN